MQLDYKNLEIYTLSHQFALDIYATVAVFPPYEYNNLTSQLRRAATCLPLNIAEGSGARSARIFLNFLTFCYRSTRECEAALKLALDIGHITPEAHNALVAKLTLLTKKLYRYMQYIESKIEKKRTRTYYYAQHKGDIDREQNSENSDNP